MLKGVSAWNRKSDEIVIWEIISADYVAVAGYLKRNCVLNFSVAAVILAVAPMLNTNLAN